MDTERATLAIDGAVQDIQPQIYALLEILIANNHRIVSKQELVDHVWRNRNTSNASIDTGIRSARQAIGDNGHDQRLIKTFKKQGFRFVLPVTALRPDNTLLRKQWSKLNKHKGFAGGMIAAALLALATATPLLIDRIGVIYDRANPADVLRQTSSIAVLPFKDISVVSAQSNLSEGFTEELMNTLMQIEGLKVSSRTSTEVILGKDLPIEEMASTLNVANILEGSLQREGDILRISVRLIDAKTNMTLWNNVYDHLLQSESMFEIKNDIARSIANNLSTEMALSGIVELPQTLNLEAYEYFLAARKLQKEATPDAFADSVKEFQKVLQIDSGYAPAYAGLVQSYYRLHRLGLLSHAEARDLLNSNLRSAQNIAPDSWEVLRAAGMVALWNDQPEKALGFFKKLTTLAPNHSDGYLGYGVILKTLGRFDEAKNAFEKALEFDPLSPLLLSNLQYLQLAMGDIENAFKTAQLNVQWNGDDIEVQTELAELHWLKGDYANAHLLYLNALDKSTDHYAAQIALSRIYRDIGRQDLSIKVATQKNVKATALAFAGDFEAVKAIAGSKPSDPDIAVALHIAGENKLALEIARDTVDNYGLLNPDTKIAAHDFYSLARWAYVLKESRDERAKGLLAKLGQHFSDRPLIQYQTIEDFQAGIAFFLMRNDPDTALAHLDEAIDRGFVMLQLTKEPMFAMLERNAAYKPRYQRMKTKAQRHHSSISEQISNR